jgi:hypothetical protein
MVMIQRLARVGHIIMQDEKPIARKGKLRGEDKWMEESWKKWCTYDLGILTMTRDYKSSYKTTKVPRNL